VEALTNNKILAFEMVGNNPITISYTSLSLAAAIEPPQQLESTILV
jgi:hypothetical protein